MSYKFFKIATANLLRYATRTVLTGVGLALAIAAVLFVNVVALSFESGAANVYNYIRSTQYGFANVWVTPPSGFKLDPNTGFFTTEGTLQENIAEQILKFIGNRGIKVVTAQFPATGIPLVVCGRSDRKEVSLSQMAAQALKLKPGDKLSLNQVSVSVNKVGNVPDVGAGGLIELPLLVGQGMLHLPSQVSWVMLDDKDIQQLRAYMTTQMNAIVTTDPTVKNRNKSIIAYVLEGKLGRGDLVTFSVKLAALYFNKASSTLLAWLAKITLGLGFILMLTAALLSIEERRREFGILTAVGVSGDILYLFLLESLILFICSTILGIVIGSCLLLSLTPALFSWTIVLKSSVFVACYLPPMIIFGSLIPAQQLLQKSPIELLRSAT